jgi:hypothetical protein
MTTETKCDFEGLYGFGATAPEAHVAMRRRRAHVLSLFAVALSTAVIALIILLLPAGSAEASPLVTQAVQAPNSLGYTAVAAFGFSTAMCAALLLAPTLFFRKKNRHR